MVFFLKRRFFQKPKLKFEVTFPLGMNKRGFSPLDSTKRAISSPLRRFTTLRGVCMRQSASNKKKQNFLMKLGFFNSGRLSLHMGLWCLFRESKKFSKSLPTVF